MAKPLNEIIDSYKGLYISEDNAKYTKMSDYTKARMPKYLQQPNNNKFFEFVDKILSFHNKMLYWNWILETQFNIYTAKGKFLDNLGRWQGLSRPPLPTKRTTEPVVIFPTKDMTPDELQDFNELHGLTGQEGVDTDVQNTFFPSLDFIGETLVNDNEYRIYIQGMLELKKGLSMPTIIDVFTRVLRKPFFITQHNADALILTAHFEEDSIRLVLAREMTARLRSTGFDIEVRQSIDKEPQEIIDKYGEGCLDQKNPYFTDDEEEGDSGDNEGGVYDEDTYIITHPDIPIVTIGNKIDVIVETDASDFKYNVLSSGIKVTRENNVLTIEGISVGDVLIEITAQATGRNPIAHTLKVMVQDLNATQLEFYNENNPIESLKIRENDTAEVEVRHDAKDFTYYINNSSNINVTKNNNILSIIPVQRGGSSIYVVAQKDNSHESSKILSVTIIPTLIEEKAWAYYKIALQGSQNACLYVNKTRDFTKEKYSKVVDFYANDSSFAFDTIKTMLNSERVNGNITQDEVTKILNERTPIPDELQDFDWASLDTKTPYYPN